MKYKIWDKVNNEYLDLTEYCVNGFGDVMTTKGLVMMNQEDFKIEFEIEKIKINKESIDKIASEINKQLFK